MVAQSFARFRFIAGTAFLAALFCLSMWPIVAFGYAALFGALIVAGPVLCLLFVRGIWTLACFVLGALQRFVTRGTSRKGGGSVWDRA